MSDGARARRVILLGPQAPVPTLASVRTDLVKDRTLGARDAVPTITAGWQERESEDAELDAELASRSCNLRLYERADEVIEADPDLARAHRAVQDRLKLLRRAYNLRLAHLIEAWREVDRLDGDAALVSEERAAALESIRSLDARHLERVRELRAEFERLHAPTSRDSVRRHRDEICARIQDAPVVVIAGGHIATLLNRLRLFDLRDALAERTVVAWSAGAMALGSRIVLFHDRPPQGPGNAEAFENGLALFADLIPFPHASRRLRLDDPARIGRLARRLAPSACALLEAETRLEWHPAGWRDVSAGSRLTDEGRRVSLDGWGATGTAARGPAPGDRSKGRAAKRGGAKGRKRG